MYLAEVDERRLFLGEGYSCLFLYATAVLRMSQAQAYLRIQIARLARRFPVILDLLAEGALNLSTLKLLDSHLTDENHTALLERARNKTKREVELLVAEIAPLPDVPSRTRKLPEPAASKQPSRNGDAAQPVSVPAVLPATASLHAQQATAVQSSVSVAAPAQVQRAFVLEAPRASCTPLGRGRYRLEMTASQSLHDKLTQLKHLLRHQVPNGDTAVVVELAFDLLLEKKLKQRFAQVAKPRASTDKSRAAVASVRERDGVQSARESSAVEHGAAATERLDTTAIAEVPSAHTPGTKAELVSSSKPLRRRRSRYIPRAVLREVFARDGGQCTFTSPGGHRCSEPGMLELHHVRAFELGGETTVENLALTCRGHNGFFADKDFGAAFMRMKRVSSKAAKRSRRPG
jgi:5-methylcytosine-specific restriction endonuclease McrA